MYPLQEPAARHELFAQAGAIRAARQGPPTTDIGFGLPGEEVGRHWWLLCLVVMPTPASSLRLQLLTDTRYSRRRSSRTS